MFKTQQGVEPIPLTIDDYHDKIKYMTCINVNVITVINDIYFPNGYVAALQEIDRISLDMSH